MRRFAAIRGPPIYSDFGLRLNRLNRYADLQTARIIRLCNPGERRGDISEPPPTRVERKYPGLCITKSSRHRYSNYQRATGGSNPARREAYPKGVPTKRRAEVFALP